MVDEGIYKDADAIKTQVVTINSPFDQGDFGTVEEEHKNLNYANYVAYDTHEVEVIGRLKTLRLIDISDAAWTDVFWRGDYKHSGTCYFPGTSNSKGQVVRATAEQQRYTLPMYKGVTQV